MDRAEGKGRREEGRRSMERRGRDGEEGGGRLFPFLQEFLRAPMVQPTTKLGVPVTSLCTTGASPHNVGRRRRVLDELIGLGRCSLTLHCGDSGARQSTPPVSKDSRWSAGWPRATCRAGRDHRRGRVELLQFVAAARTASAT